MLIFAIIELMAVFDGSSLREGFTVGVRTSTPRVRIRDVKLGKRRIYVTGDFELGAKRYSGDVYYYGRFNYSGGNLRSGFIKRFALLPDAGGAFKGKGIRIDVQQLGTKSPWENEKDMLRGADKIIGSNFNDILKGREGDDILIGRGGVNRLTGGSGRDAFVLNSKGRQIISDFNVKDDFIQLAGSPSGYEWYKSSGKSIIARDGAVLAEFLGAPNLDNATFL